LHHMLSACMHTVAHATRSLKLATHCAAPCTVAQQPAVRRRAAWRGTRVTEPHAASVAAMRRHYWRDTMVCSAMRTGAAKTG
jgi:hypothetical protein